MMLAETEVIAAREQPPGDNIISLKNCQIPEFV